MLNTSVSAFACVAWIYMNVSPTGDNRGQVIDMCRRTQDKQPTPNGVTPACLIHFDCAKTERWADEGRAVELRIKWQRGSSFCLRLQTKWMHVNVKNHTWCITRQDCALEGNKQMRRHIKALVVIYADIRLILFHSWLPFCFIEHHYYCFGRTFLIMCHSQSFNGTEICAEKSHLFPPTVRFFCQKTKIRGGGDTLRHLWLH